MGLRISVYRDDLPDCTKGGVTSRRSDLTVVNVDGPFEPTADAPAVMLFHGNIKTALPKLVPVGLEGKWTMFGGNYAGTSDSRFADAVERLCGVRANIVPVHDRVE